MPKFVIERDIPGAGDLTRDQLREISQTSCRVLAKLGYTNPVDRELRDRRQNLLHLSLAERRSDPGARGTRRVPRKSNITRYQRHRSHNGRVLTLLHSIPHP